MTTTKSITARYPSNIALVKYWGKYGEQMPCNASLSMTLSQAFTEVKLSYTQKKSKAPALVYSFNGQPHELFRQRIFNYVTRQKAYTQLLEHYSLRMESTNSFPHSTGIASSASAFAAIAAALLKANSASEMNFTRKASCLARLGSGSACRSFYGPFVLWGQLDDIRGSSNDYAIPVNAVHPNFRRMSDAILIVEDAPKKVSSSTGHALMSGHPFANARFKQANKHCLAMVAALKSGDFDAFISITEREALSLHAMMMTSQDYYFLIKPKTLEIIEQITQFRKDTKLPLCFTLDAGPNVHVLYPESIQSEVHSFLKQISIKSIIYDHAGVGGTVF